jgi:23S rRNA (cytidine2498-2'-O)-methyltransferase
VTLEIPPQGWLYTTRERFEDDLLEELSATAALAPRKLAPALVWAAGRPAEEPTFARQLLPVAFEARGEELASQLASGLLAEYERLTAERRRPFTLHLWVADADASNPLSGRAQELERAVLQKLLAAPELSRRHLEDAFRARELEGILLQACLLEPERAVGGALYSLDAHSLFHGGRARLKMPQKAPSRAALKLEEAFLWLGRGPEPGDLCADLGAAPGGWSYVLLERRARVIAVDPAKLAPDIMKRKGLRHVQESAFQFEPGEPVTWLCCDMAWRPLEAAQLLAKWARRRWASFLVANLKLPMKKKAEFVREIKKTVAGGGWRDVRARQLYHDREEITLGGWRM